MNLERERFFKSLGIYATAFGLTFLVAYVAFLKPLGESARGVAQESAIELAPYETLHAYGETP